MSIEQALAENTAAIRELIEAIKQGVPTTQAQDTAVVTEAADTKPAKAETPKAENKTEAPKQEAEEPSAAAAEVSLDDVVAATLALGKAGKRQQLVEKLGELGAAKASALPEAEWAGYVEWANALLEA